MAHKKTFSTMNKATRKRLVRSGHSGKFALMSPSARLAVSRAAKSSTAHVPMAPVRIALTNADIARIDEICADPPAVTDHMRAAIERNRKFVRA